MSTTGFAAARRSSPGSELPELDMLPCQWLALGVLALAALAGLFGAQLPASMQVWLLAVAVVASLPHGGADLPLARALLKPRLGQLWLPVFVAGYVVLAGSTVAVWLMAPVIALSLFLLMSVVHFGETDATQKALNLFGLVALGAAPIVVPSLSHPAELAKIFGVVAGGDGDALVPVLQQGGAIVWLLAVAAHVLHVGDSRQARTDLVQLAITCGTFAVLPPLAAFAVYFSLIHSSRALVHAANCVRRPVPWLLRASLWPSFAALLFLAAGYAVLASIHQSDVAAVRVAFVGLSALTVPHMVLAIVLRAPRSAMRSLSDMPSSGTCPADASRAV